MRGTSLKYIKNKSKRIKSYIISKKKILRKIIFFVLLLNYCVII